MENKRIKMLYLFLLHIIINIFTLNAQIINNENGFPGTVELVQNNIKNNLNNNNHRRSRVSKDFVPVIVGAGNSDDNDDDESGRYIEIDSIQVKTKENLSVDETPRYLRNFKPYINSDTENLTDQQKVLLKNIADRIARYGVSMMNINNGTTATSENEGRASATTAKTTNKIKVKTTNKPSSTIKSTTKRIVTIPTTVKSSKLSTVTASKSTPITIVERKNSPTTNQQQKQYIELPQKVNSKKIKPISSIQNTDSTSVNEPSALINSDNVTTSAIIDSLSRENAREDFYERERPQTENNKNKKTPATSGTGKPTKYHYYPHNQHIYLLPECAIQQVCNAVYVRLNYTQPLCACPSRYRDPCSASLNEDDLHTTKLIGDANRKAITLAKTCEATTEMRECRAPKDWSLLALQNTRTGKSHYLVICRCPDNFKLDGPMAHDQPTYASVPGIRVFGMMCVKPGAIVRRPTEIPPIKRYQNQKPFNTYNQPINQYSTVRPAVTQQQQQFSTLRPNSPQNDYNQNQYQTTYQYLKRPGSPINKPNGNQVFQNGSPTFGNGYGRVNQDEKIVSNENSEGEDEINGDEEIENLSRSKRSTSDNNELMPEFPWHRVKELHDSIVWD